MGSTDFDFLHGNWTVHHRRLVERLSGSSDWEEFDGRMECRPLLGGHANIDDNEIDLPGGSYRALTLRFYSGPDDRWTIHWIDGRDPRLDPPMIGRFDKGVGTFFGNDELHEHPVRVRFIWDQIGPEGARWQQAFAWPGSEAWETNWTMEFRRPS